MKWPEAKQGHFDLIPNFAANKSFEIDLPENSGSWSRFCHIFFF